jgi:hypothetical protein
MPKLMVLFSGIVCVISLTYGQVAINESDYQNPSTNQSEWIELVGAAGTSLDDWAITLIDQNGNVYGNYTLQGTIPYDFDSEWGGRGGFFVVGVFDATTEIAAGAPPDYTPPGWVSNVIQNGTDDVIQLYDDQANLVDEWEYDNYAAASVTGNSEPFTAADSAGTPGDINTYSSIGRVGWSYDEPLFVFDVPHGIGSSANDPFDHQNNSADFWASTPRGPVTESSYPEIRWSGTLEYGPNRGITPGSFNHASWGTGTQDAYTVNIVPEPGAILLLGLGSLYALHRRKKKISLAPPK